MAREVPGSSPGVPASAIKLTARWWMKNARLAQLAEHAHGKGEVSGSNPLPGSEVTVSRCRGTVLVTCKVLGQANASDGESASSRQTATSADVAQLAAHQLPKLEVAGSSPVVRSKPACTAAGPPRPRLRRRDGEVPAPPIFAGRSSSASAVVAQRLAHHLAKVGVAGSNPVSRSRGMQ